MAESYLDGIEIFGIVWSIFKRRRGDAEKNGWNDDGCGKKGVFPEEMVGNGGENIFEKTRFL